MTDQSSARFDQALELMYYAFKGLVEAPDRQLADQGLARTHHRILYFVARQPGLTVGNLLALLKVTKQALNQPLRTLIRRGLVKVDSDRTDRRVRRLWLGSAGKTLERRLTGMQHGHFARVFAQVGPGAEKSWREVMRRLGVVEPSGVESAS